MDDHSLRIAVLLSAHLIFLSAGALRILRGQRAHLLVADAPWWIQYYPPLVWVPFVVAYVQPLAIDLDQNLRLVGLAIAAGSIRFDSDDDARPRFGRWFGLSPFANGGAERILTRAGAP